MSAIASQNILLRRRLKRLFRILVVLSVCVLAISAEHLPIKTYRVADGLPNDNIYEIRRDARGFLWFCSDDGISRFDGYAFTNFTIADGLPDRHVNDFIEATNGKIYIATDSGIARLNPNGLSGSSENPLFTIIQPADLNARKITVLFEDEVGQVWVGTNIGLYTITEQDELSAFDLGAPATGIQENLITSIIKDRRGSMWIGTIGNGLVRILPDRTVEQFNTSDGLPDILISSLHEDKNGRLWAGLRPNYGAGLVLLVPEPRKGASIVERHYTTKDGLPSNWVLDLHESSDGRFWVGTIKGLCEWQGEGKSVCKTYTKENDLCDEEIWSIGEDNGRGIWIGTRCGLKKWTPYGFTAYTEADGMGYTFINSLFENRAGELFASFNSGTGPRTVSRYAGARFDLVTPQFPPGVSYGWGWKQTVLQDSTGAWWFPAIQGIYRFPSTTRFEDLSKLVPQLSEVGTRPAEAFRIFEDSRGDVWVSTIGNSSELWRWERASDSWQDFTNEVKFGPERIGSTFVEDKSGNLWIGAGTERKDAALIRYRDGRFTVFPQSENPLLAGWLRDLIVDREGRLWIADTANGVLRLDDVNSKELNFVRYTIENGLSTNGSFCLTEDQFGRIYVGSGRGLDRITPETGVIENFTTADGLPSSDIEIAYRDRRNYLWFGTSNGLALLIPEPESFPKAPSVFITGLRINGEPRSVSVLGETAIPKLNLDSDHRQVTIDFVGTGSSLGEKLQYEYRINDDEWAPTKDRTVNFANLGSGDYRFEVRVRTLNKLFSPHATVGFNIAAPVWQRWWFIGALLVSTILIFYGLYRFRVSRLLEVANMRTRIATDLHDDIGANLTKISILSEVAQQQFTHDPASDEKNSTTSLLGSVAEISRESVSSMGDIVWAINPKKDTLLDLTRRMRQHAEDIFERRDIRLDFDASGNEHDQKLDANIRRNVYLIFKESVSNIVRHSNASAVSIKFVLVENDLFFRISDDGDGFDTADESDGNGLLNMYKRAEESGGRLSISSMKGKGTMLEYHLRLRSAKWNWRNVIGRER